MAGFYLDDDEESPLVAFGGTLSAIGGSIYSAPPKDVPPSEPLEYGELEVYRH